MYTPEAFREDSAADIRRLVRRHPFASLVSVVDGEPLISQLPLLWDTDAGTQGSLLGHLARANPQAGELADGRRATALFHGPDAYVSPAWYGSPGVPTWNYASVSISGECRLIDDAGRLWALLLELTDTQETVVGEAWRPQIPAAKREQLLSAIVGFELRVTRVEAKFKLSQNRPRADLSRILQGLERSADGAAVAALIRDLDGGLS